MLQVNPGNHPFRQQADDRQINAADQRQARQNAVDVLRRVPPGRIPGMKPPYFRMLSASSVGLKMIPT
jgi:hypothetical protein